MKKSASPLRAALWLVASACLPVVSAAPLVTSQNSTLSIPAARISMAGLPWATNLVGSNLMLSSVASATQQGGKATLVNSLEWVRRYNGGPGSFDNAAYAMAVRGDGSVVVSGPSYKQATDYDLPQSATPPMVLRSGPTGMTALRIAPTPLTTLRPAPAVTFG